MPEIPRQETESLTVLGRTPPTHPAPMVPSQVPHSLRMLEMSGGKASASWRTGHWILPQQFYFRTSGAASVKWRVYWYLLHGVGVTLNNDTWKGRTMPGRDKVEL